MIPMEKIIDGINSAKEQLVWPSESGNETMLDFTLGSNNLIIK
jgi:hypothetical protein